MDVALPCLRASSSVPGRDGLALAAHDFLIAAFTARKGVSAWFVPTYINVFIPTAAVDSGLEGGGPSLGLLERFASCVRAVCQGLEASDGGVLQGLLDGGGLALSPALKDAVAVHAEKLHRLTPVNAVLLIISSLFDMLCVLWNATPGFITDTKKRFFIYFSALANLLQCTTTQVLNRACASIEAIMIEHLSNAIQVQHQLLKYVGSVVDRIEGNSKKGVAEWFLKLNNRVLQKSVPRRSKL
ncbi:unnamed protein product, partial [Phytomonas sp. EM1]